MTEPTTHGPRRAAFAFVFVTVMLDMFAIGIIIPVLPRLVEDFMGGDTARAATIYGIFGTAWALMQFLFMPVLGSLSDRVGRRPIILLSNFGLGLDYVSWRSRRICAGCSSAASSPASPRRASARPARTSQTSPQPSSAPQSSVCSVPRSALASSWARHSAVCSATSVRVCPSGSQPVSA
jgi:MFS family permease